jgi:flagellar motility protein MotE (MotC chaperone)
MIGFIRDLRLIPIAVVACACLLALKAADLLLADNSLFTSVPPGAEASVIHSTPDVSPTVLSWATQMFNFPNGRGGAPPASVVEPIPADRFNPDITGTVTPEGAEKPGPQASAAPQNPPPATQGTVIPLDAQGQPVASGAERAILERLGERRQELDTRARELDIRESLIKAAEKRMEGQLAELKETEQRITGETQQKDDAQAAQFKGLVTMYENMKPRDAAKIFDRLEIGVLIAVASKIDPRHMADILAQMSPDMAERLTVELASKAQQVKQSSSPNDLPKIQGQTAAP